jgi:hypothetical protein
MANPNRTYTRIIAPAVVSIRGGGAGGHEGQTKGDFSQTAFHIELPSAQTGDSFQVEKPDGTVIYKVDCNGNAGIGKAVHCITQVPLTAAQIIAMFTTPVSILPAPGAGKAIIVEQITVELNLTATAFSGGGVVHFYYHGLTAEVMAQTLAAATINGGAGQTISLLEPVQTAGGSVVTKEVGIDITNATGVFATGTGAAVVTIWYSIVTLG